MQKASIFLISTLLILSSCGSYSPKELSSTQGFSISYPSNFVAGKDTSRWIALTDKSTGTIIVINKTEVVNPKTDNEIIQWYNSKSPVENSGEFSANWHKWAFVEFTTKYTSTAMYHRDSWIHEWGYVYGIACTTKETEKSNIQKVCSNISSSLKIK